jgi:hypothetical protein
MENAFKTTLPLCLDRLKVIRNMDTTSVATTFPFTSSELTANEGILYGINKHNGSLIIFDRFSLENANSVIFAKSGSGKSYFVKLEALRYMMFGSQVIVIDPEHEYLKLCQAVGGWDQVRSRLLGNEGRPMIYFFSTCVDQIRTLPALQHDPDKPEDVDTDSEDHGPDSTRYACMSRPFVRQAEPKPTDKILGIGTHNQVTWDELIENQPTASRGSGRI